MLSTSPSTKLLFVLGSFALCGYAQDFYWNTSSARSMALGGVYLPSAGGAIDAMAANPAGLSTLGGRTVDLSLTSIFASGSFSNSVNSNRPLQDSPGVVPYGAFGMPLGHSGFSIGAGITPELMSESNWNYVDAPGVAGASYGLQQQKSAILAARIGFGAAYSFGKKLAIGISEGAVYNSNTLIAPYIFQSNPALAGLKTLVNLHTNGFGWNTSVGILANPSSHVQVNAAWKSRTVIDSTGGLSGDIGAQLAAVGIAAPSTFHYDATVHNVLPQSVLAGVNFRIDGRWVFALQGNWVNWNDAFSGLPLSLTNGTNPAINGLLGTNAIADRVPLEWKDQYSIHSGAEYRVTEGIFVRAGYGFANNPVPSSTLSPLTAAIMTNQLSAGIGYRHNRWRLDLAYGIDPSNTEHVGQSALLSGEYNNSSVRISTQALALNTSFVF